MTMNIFSPNYSLASRETQHPPLSISPCSTIEDMSALRAARASPAPLPVRPPNRSGSPSSFASCMEGGVAHETYSQALKHAGHKAEQHLRSAAALFASALEHQPESTWAALRRAGVLLHLSSHCHYEEQLAALLESRELLVGLGDAEGARDGLASVCSRLAELEPRGGYAAEALEALEDVAGERMDRASALTREAFENETPALADTFLALANAAAKVSGLASDLDTSDMYAELAERALEQAANMATLAAAADAESAAVLVARVQLGSAAIVASRLKHLVRLGVGLDELQDDWTYLLNDLTELAGNAREHAAKHRGSKGAVAAGTAYLAVKQLADTRVLYATLLRERFGNLDVIAPLSPHADFAMISTPGLERSRGSWSSASGSLDSPPILEETEAEVAAASEQVVPPLPLSPPQTPISPKGKQRAPPPPPLMLSHLPSQFQAVQIHPRRTPLTPLTPLPPSPLNPARRASDSSAQRPILTRGPSFQRPRRATVLTFSPITPAQPDAHAAWHHLAAAVKGYKLALALLSASDQRDPVRKSTVLLSIARASTTRAELAGMLTHTPTPPTPRAEPRSGVQRTGTDALYATAEVYATWAAREVGWSKVLEPTERGVRLGARADEVGLAAVLTTLEIWNREGEAKEVWERLAEQGVSSGDVERARARLGRWAAIGLPP